MRAPRAPFSATLAFDHPTPNALVAFLAPALEEAYARDFDVVHDEETIAGDVDRLRTASSITRSFSLDSDSARDVVGRRDGVERVDVARIESASIDGQRVADPWVRWDADAVVADAFVLAPRHGGYLRDVAAFDGEAFGVAPAEASAMDPQQRMTLAWFSAVAGSFRPATMLPSSSGCRPATSDYGRLIADGTNASRGSLRRRRSRLALDAGVCARSSDGRIEINTPPRQRVDRLGGRRPSAAHSNRRAR